MTEMALTVGDAVLRATVTGAGPTVLLLHAGGEHRGVWAPTAARLAASGLRTVAYDLRGHGQSTGRATTLRVLADDVIEMVRREPTPIVVVGASAGGYAALAALADPVIARRVAGLVLVDAVPNSEPDRVRSWLAARGLLDQYADLTKDILASGPQLLTAAAALDMPILLVRAGRSPIKDTDFDRFHTANRRIALTVLPGVGHLVAQEAPAELAGLVSAHAATWLAGDQVVHRAFDLQRTLGSAGIEHPGGTLLAHLRRVHALTVEWQATPRTRLAAICHASYGTDGFAHALLSAVERQRLREVIGHDAEALVYLYGACDRAQTYRVLGQRDVTVVDRFTGGSSVIRGSDLCDFAVLTIANELDVARHAELPASTRAGIKGLVMTLAQYAPDEAALALADRALA